MTVPDSAVRLVPLNRYNWREAMSLRVRPDQLAFIADHQPVALVILAKAYVGAGGLTWEPLGVVADDRMVGLVAIAHRPDSHDCEVFHLMIDVAIQGRGMGRSALQAVIDHVRATLPACRSLLLTVHPVNRTAMSLYEGLGFRSTGEVRDGEALLVRQLA